MEVEAYLKKFYAGTKDPSLTAIQYLMEEFGNPQKSLNFIHIAGTNGKGSITEMLSNILTKAGYRTGKFMSPHLIQYNERMAINNKNISDQEMETLILELEPKIKKYNQNHEAKITLFELETAMAILYFYRNHCDFVVLEAGLGGLYDCTNMVQADISIISSIGYDHMNILGNTLEEIAVQKAGIIKENGNTIFVKQEKMVNQIIENACKERKNVLHMVNPNDISKISFQEDLTKFTYLDHENIEINLKGFKQIQNAAICLECVEILKNKNYKIAEQAVREALKTVVHKGRFEMILKNPKIIFDGAHNEPAIENLKNSIHLYYKKAPKVFIISIFDTKDYRKILQQLLQEDAIFIFTDGNNQGRFIPKEILYDFANKIAKNKTVYQYKIADAIRFIKKKYKDHVTFIIGSFYVYETVMKELKEEKYDTN